MERPLSDLDDENLYEVIYKLCMTMCHITRGMGVLVDIWKTSSELTDAESMITGFEGDHS